MRTLVYDLDKDQFEKLDIDTGEALLIQAEGKYAACLGCFKCWLKQRGYCVINDKLQHMGAILGRSEQLTIIGRLCYGGYSSRIKAILDRSISTSLPFFTWRGRQTHHISRYPEGEVLRLIFYGDNTEFERKTAEELAERNRLNLNFKRVETRFLDSAEQLRGMRI